MTPVSRRTGRLALRGPAVLGHPGQDRELSDRRQRARGHRCGVRPLDWRLYVPEAWDDACADTRGRGRNPGTARRAGIPDTVRHRTKWRLALEMIDEVIAWGHQPPVIAADAGYGDTTAFRQGLSGRNIPYVVAVKASTSAFPADAVPVTAPYAGRGPRATDRYREKPAPCGNWPWPPATRHCRRSPGATAPGPGPATGPPR